MPTKKEKPIFRGLTIALAGDLGGQWTETNITRWLSLRDGKFNQQMDESVTHLVCSDAEFRARGARVKAAIRRGSKACKIVTKDWLEDSLLRNRKLPEKEFSLDYKLRKEREKTRREAKIAKGLEQAEKGVNSNLYHIYTDSTFFRYEVTITRDSDEHDIHGERYVMTLYESNARPHLYWFVAKFYKRRGDTQPKFHRPSDTPALFSHEFAGFERFFLIKTGIPWAKRLIGKVETASTGRVLFQYTPPTRGPVGHVDPQFMPVGVAEATTEPEPHTTTQSFVLTEAEDTPRLTTGGGEAAPGIGTPASNTLENTVLASTPSTPEMPLAGRTAAPTPQSDNEEVLVVESSGSGDDEDSMMDKGIHSEQGGALSSHTVVKRSVVPEGVEVIELD